MGAPVVLEERAVAVVVREAKLTSVQAPVIPVVPVLRATQVRHPLGLATTGRLVTAGLAAMVGVVGLRAMLGVPVALVQALPPGLVAEAEVQGAVPVVRVAAVARNLMAVVVDAAAVHLAETGATGLGVAAQTAGNGQFAIIVAVEEAQDREDFLRPPVVGVVGVEAAAAFPAIPAMVAIPATPEVQLHITV